MIKTFIENYVFKSPEDDVYPGSWSLADAEVVCNDILYQSSVAKTCNPVTGLETSGAYNRAIKNCIADIKVFNILQKM